MPTNILSWNIKSFVASVSFRGNRIKILEQVLNAFDLIFMYEVPNTTNGTNNLNTLVGNLNNIIGGRHYASLTVASGGLGKENDVVAVVYETNALNVVNTTGTRRPNGTSGRAPAYFDVTDLNSNNTREFCAWHAPEPQNAAQLIAQGWQNIKINSVDNNRTGLTAVIVGDFNNGNLTTPKRGAGRNLSRQITPGSPNGTTLVNTSSTNYNSTLPYRTGNTYDQIFLDDNLLTSVGRSGIYDVMAKLVNNAAPFTGLFNTQYNTPLKAFQFYRKISDHLPVAITLTL